MLPRLSTSRAYWNLRAEQVMDRVFNADEHTLDAVRVQIDAPQPSERRQWTPGQLSLLTLTLVGILSTLIVGLQWWSSQQALQRERNLALIERLRQRSLETPPTSEDTATEAAQEPTPALPAIQQLEPVTIPIPSQSQPTEATPDPLVDVPLLVGVVYSGGDLGSAIFQVGAQSLSAVPGESIANSGWTLRNVTANGVVIERNGDSRSLSVGGAF